MLLYVLQRKGLIKLLLTVLLLMIIIVLIWIGYRVNIKANGLLVLNMLHVVSMTAVFIAVFGCLNLFVEVHYLDAFRYIFIILDILSFMNVNFQIRLQILFGMVFLYFIKVEIKLSFYFNCVGVSGSTFGLIFLYRLGLMKWLEVQIICFLLLKLFLVYFTINLS